MDHNNRDRRRTVMTVWLNYEKGPPVEIRSAEDIFQTNLDLSLAGGA